MRQIISPIAKIVSKHNIKRIGAYFDKAGCLQRGATKIV